LVARRGDIDHLTQAQSGVGYAIRVEERRLDEAESRTSAFPLEPTYRALLASATYPITDAGAARLLLSDTDSADRWVGCRLMAALPP
jgi:hypothetical protein